MGILIGIAVVLAIPLGLFINATTDWYVMWCEDREYYYRRLNRRYY